MKGRSAAMPKLKDRARGSAPLLDRPARRCHLTGDMSTASPSPGPRARSWGRRGTAGASIPVAIDLENVTQDYGSVKALRDVTISIRPREIVCLLGQSGCGKTTLLRMVAGVESPTSGRVLLDGIEVAGPSRYMPPEQRGVGLMFQDYALFPHLSVADNVAFGLRALSRAEAAKVAQRALDRVGLGHHLASFPHTLSGGEQQRVALARAIAPRPGVLLMDEPFANLDRRLRDAVREETMTVLRETGATVILVTHDPEEALRMADRVILMRAGRIVQQGPGPELYRNPVDLFAARFFCDYNEIEAKVSGGRAETPLGTFAASGIGDGRSAVVCIRPHGIRLELGQCGTAGRVIDFRSIGEVDLARIVVDGLDKPIHARLPVVGAALTPRIGQDVRVTIAPDEVLVFPALDA